MLREHCQFVNYDDKDDMPDLNINVVKLPYTKTEEYKQAYREIDEEYAADSFAADFIKNYMNECINIMNQEIVF